MSNADYNLLVESYSSQIEFLGIDEFEMTVLQGLRDAQKYGEVLNSGSMDENTTVKANSFPIEKRILAANTARKMYFRGVTPGPQVLSVNFGGITNLR